MSGETLKIAATDLSDTAHITSWEGILLGATYRGDLIELDFEAGAVWQGGEAAAYTFEVPLVMKSQDVGTAVGDMRAIQALNDGTEKAIIRVLTVDTTSVSETCQGVVTSATPIWDLRQRNKVGLLLTIQNLSGLWTVTS